MSKCPRKIKVAPEEQSMYDKVGIMNGMALSMVDDANKYVKQLTEKFGENKVSNYWGIADGLDEKYIMKRITGQCSLSALLEPIEDLEKMVDDNIILLKEFEQAIKELDNGTGKIQVG